MKEIISHLPSSPGVYLFKDVSGNILYVGKAINLKSRVSSYFTDTHLDRPWIKVMLHLIYDVETIVVDNELEALMLEATLIKQHLPRFNIKLTDDKSYPYIKLSRDPFARFSVVRRQINDKSSYFGPYLSARSALNSLEFLRSVYGIHISQSPLKQNRMNACFYCQLNGFSCVLADEMSHEKYEENVSKAVNFLQGKRKSLLKDVENKMHAAAETHQFELAAKLRDQLQSMTQIITNQQVISTTMNDFDAIGIARTKEIASLTLLRVRAGRVQESHNFFFTIIPEEPTGTVIRQFLLTIYRNFTEVSPLIVTNDEFEDKEVITQLLQQLFQRKITIKIAQRGDKADIVALAQKNAQSRLATKLLRTNQAFSGLLALQELLTLPYPPHRIEAVDISNLGSSEPVGAIVCFIDGQPAKDEYRRYKIKTVQGQNDFAMIGEIVKRRFSDTSRNIPDVFVVDGGPEQLKFAIDALQGLPVQPAQIIGLAKKPDRIFLPNKKMPLAATRGNKGLYLLARIRDEVHRFGISFQRSRQRKKSLQVEE